MAYNMAGVTVQVTPLSFRAISNKISKFSLPNRARRAAANARQLIVALDGGDLLYYELEGLELSLVHQCSLDSEVRCLNIAEIGEGKARSNFLVVGLINHTVRILSLVPGDCLKRLSVQSLGDLPESVVLVEMVGHS
jgi:splicing factor 3B subunit 3